jgi:hypothetical protein
LLFLHNLFWLWTFFYNLFGNRRRYRWHRLNFLLYVVVSWKLTGDFTEIEDRHLRQLLKDWFSSLRPSGNKLLERRVIVISDDRNGVAGDALASHPWCSLLEVANRLADWDAVRYALL